MGTGARDGEKPGPLWCGVQKGEMERGRPRMQEQTETRTTLLLTLRTPESDVDVELPADIPISAFLPLIQRLCSPVSPKDSGQNRPWALGPLEGEPFDSARTLAQEGVADGHMLRFWPLDGWPKPPVRPEADEGPTTAPAQDGLTPLERTRASLPDPFSLVARIKDVCRSLAGPTLRQGRMSQAATAPQPEGDVPSAGRRPLSPEVLTVQTKPGLVERVRSSWRRTDYLSRLDAAIAKPQLKRCATIAVVSPKGGVGKTTITALLGTLFAQVRRDRIVAVDTNPDFGSLGRMLTPDHQVFVDDLLELLDDRTLTVTTLDAHLGRTEHGLMILPAPTDPARMARLDEEAYVRVVRRLQDMVGVVVLDCGTGLQDPAARAALRMADQIILVSDAQPATASLVAEAAGLLEQVGKPMWLVVNKWPRRRHRLDVQALAVQIPQARGLLYIQTEEQAADRVSAGAFDWRDAPASWKRGIRELAVVLTGAWVEQGIAKPFAETS